MEEKEKKKTPSHTEEQSLCGCCCAGKGWIPKNVDGYPLIDAQIITHAHGSLKWLILFQELQLLAAFCTLTQLTKYSKSWILFFFFLFFFTDFSFNSFQTFARFLHWFITCLNVFVISLFHQMTVNTFYRHSIYTMKKGDNFGFFMRGKYQFILMFVVGTHVFAKCLQKQRGGGGLLKYFFLREGLRVTALLKWYKST